MWWGEDGVAPIQQVLRDVENMREHPACKLPMIYYKSGIKPAKFKVKTDDSKIADFVYQQITRIWSRSLQQIQDAAYDWGWCGAEVCYTEEKSLLCYGQMKDFSPNDVMPLVKNKKFVGVRVAMQGWAESIAGGQVKFNETTPRLDLWSAAKADPAKGFWYAHNQRYGGYYGVTQFRGSWRPWRRLAFRGGAEETIDGGIHRFAYPGPMVRFPEGSSKLPKNPPPAGRDGRLENRDRVREMAESVKSGAPIGLPSTRDEKSGQYLWDFEWPKVGEGFNPEHLVSYIKYLKDEISFGIGVPPEIMQASDTGSGYSGRAIPKEAFFLSQQNIATAIVWALDKAIIKPLVQRNFGWDKHYEIEVEPLLQSQVQQTQGGPGGAQPPGQLPQAQGPQANGGSDILSKLFAGGGQGPSAGAPQQGGMQQMATEVPSAEITVPLPNPVKPPLPHVANDLLMVVDTVANVALAELEDLSDRVRQEIRSALATATTANANEAVAAIVRRHRPRIEQLLAETHMLAALAGMQGVTERLVGGEKPGEPGDRLTFLVNLLHHTVHRDSAIKLLDPASQERAAAVSITQPQGQRADVPSHLLPKGESATGLPLIEYAIRNIQERMPVTRDEFDAMAYDARQFAFTVAGLEEESAVARVQKAVADAVAGGKTMRDFSRGLEDVVGTSTFLSRAHMENVFRSNVMQAYSEGQMRIMDDPLIGNSFPYVRWDAIHDVRVRPDHRKMETSGLNGTNVFRADDPEFRRLRPPADYNCRCVWTPVSIEQAAQMGVREAQEWLRTGYPPAVPEFIQPIEFHQSPSWQRLGLINLSWDESKHPRGQPENAGQFTEQHAAIAYEAGYKQKWESKSQRKRDLEQAGFEPTHPHFGKAVEHYNRGQRKKLSELAAEQEQAERERIEPFLKDAEEETDRDDYEDDEEFYDAVKKLAKNMADAKEEEENEEVEQQRQKEEALEKANAEHEEFKRQEKKHRELGGKVRAAIQSAGYECEEPDGWGDSIYAEVSSESGERWKLRISNHAQKKGGGWSESKGQRHGQAEINIVYDHGVDAGLAWNDDGGIEYVPHVRLTHANDVPDDLIAAIQPVVNEAAIEAKAENTAKKKK